MRKDYQMRNWEISRSRTGKRLENVRPGDPNEVRVLLKRGASEMGVLTEDRFRMRKLHPGEPFPARGHTRSEGIQGILRHRTKLLGDKLRPILGAKAASSGAQLLYRLAAFGV